jgi:hypothetical protein
MAIFMRASNHVSLLRGSGKQDKHSFALQNVVIIELGGINGR